LLAATALAISTAATAFLGFFHAMFQDLTGASEAQDSGQHEYKGQQEYRGFFHLRSLFKKPPPGASGRG
jgi:hypothetical protein